MSAEKEYWLRVRFCGEEGPVGAFIVTAVGAVEAWEKLLSSFSQAVRRQARIEEIVPERPGQGDA